MQNKKRLIDANALKSEYEWLLSVVNPFDKAKIRDAIERIEKAPTVDAVEVVYCQDCARCKKGYCTIRKDSWGATLMVGMHDFCSDAERRADNEID